MVSPIETVGDNNFEFAKYNGEDITWLWKEQWLVISTPTSTEIIETANPIAIENRS